MAATKGGAYGSQASTKFGALKILDPVDVATVQFSGHQSECSEKMKAKDCVTTMQGATTFATQAERAISAR